MTAKELTELFQKHFEGSPTVFRAPGRVNLIGEHTDYNDGFVMPAAIGFFTSVAAGPRSDRKLAIRSENFHEQVEIDLDHLPNHRSGRWFDYLVGVAVMLEREGVGLSGANLLISGGVPIGAGLSSSAAVEVATALALLYLGKQTAMSRPQIAKLCRRAENEFVGAHVGIMDQFVSCIGKKDHAVFLDCRSLHFELVPVPPNVRMVICNTMVKHEHSTSEYNTRRQECEEGVKVFSRLNPNVRSLRDVSLELLDRSAGEMPVTVWNRCSHVIHESQRVLDAVRCFQHGNLQRLGELMRDSHRSLRDLYEVSCRELDVMVEAAEGLPGYIGGRMTGGGFGGCTVNLVKAENAADFALRIAERYQIATGIQPQIYTCTAEDGAQIMA